MAVPDRRAAHLEVTVTYWVKSWVTKLRSEQYPEEIKPSPEMLLQSWSPLLLLDIAAAEDHLECREKASDTSQRQKAIQRQGQGVRT